MMRMRCFSGTPGALTTATGGDQQEGARDFSGVTTGELTADSFYETTTRSLFDEAASVDITVSGPNTATYSIASFGPAIAGTTNDGHGHITSDYDFDDFKINAISWAPMTLATDDLTYRPGSPLPASLGTGWIITGMLAAKFGIGVLGLGAMVRRR